jgi:hypothetical protein
MYFKRLKIAVECVENLEAQDNDIYQTCAPIISHCSPNFEAILLVKWSMCNCDEKEKMNMLMTRVYHKYISKTFDLGNEFIKQSAIQKKKKIKITTKTDQVIR